MNFFPTELPGKLARAWSYFNEFILKVNLKTEDAFIRFINSEDIKKKFSEEEREALLAWWSAENDIEEEEEVSVEETPQVSEEHTPAWY
jgi:hypothetical protein